jgi:hypothetical protein
MPRRKPARRRPASKGRASKRSAAPPAARGLSLRAFARRVGVNLWAIQKAIASGRLLKSLGEGARGNVRIENVDLALREWTENASHPAGTNGDGGGDTVAEAQRLLHLERREAVRLANLQRAGRLVERARVERDSFECARTTRDSILAVADRISPQLAAESDQARVHRMLSDELRVALASIAEILDDEGRGGGGARGGGGNGGGDAER